MTKGLLTWFVLAGLLSWCASGTSGAAEDPGAIGAKVANFSLQDVREGRQVALADFKGKKAVVVLFIGVECPTNQAYLPRLSELHKEFAAREVQFLAINSNLQDPLERVAVHARESALPFPVLKDDEQKVANAFGAQRTPEAFVLNADWAIVYRGRIDDQFGIGYQKPNPIRRDLAEALEEVLAGKPVSTPTTSVSGCRISRAPRAKNDAAVSYTRDVSRILQKNCQSCHRPGQIGPMALLTYENARNWSDTIREVLEQQRMPPWHADPRYGKFSNDRSMAKEDRETLLAWIAQGCPRGDDKDLPPLLEFKRDSWVIGKPDLVLSMPQEFDVPAEAPRWGVPYRYFTVETGFPEERWVARAEAKAGASSVVHHIIVFVVPAGEKFNANNPRAVVLCGTAPGDMPFIAPEGMAKRIPAGSRLVFQLHYTPNGKAEKDRSSIGLIFTRDPQREVLTQPIFNPGFRIPAGDPNYKVEAGYTFKEDALVLGFMPHMHLRGKDFLIEANYADERTETLLSVPRFDFGWQSVYRYAQAVKAPKGTRIHCVAHFDNSPQNPNNPDPTRSVHWGDQTWDEMMIGWMDFAYDRKPH